MAIVFTMANLPFVFDRILFVVRPAGGRIKGLAWRLLELVILYLIAGALAWLLESRAHGSVYAQGWEFYVTTFCLFVVFASPGFIYRYLWHRSPSARREQ
ncbi:MAG: DUF2818 family protein [Thauera sp.]